MQQYSSAAELLTNLLSEIDSKTKDDDTKRSWYDSRILLTVIVGRQFDAVVKALECNLWRLNVEDYWAVHPPPSRFLVLLLCVASPASGGGAWALRSSFLLIHLI